MTLRELIAANPAAFYAQTWYDGEDFLDTVAAYMELPTHVVGCERPAAPATLPTAADFALLWLTHPEASLWRRYLWTRDTDRQGQRVYVGVNGKGLEIHRHLAITERWGVAIW